MAINFEDLLLVDGVQVNRYISLPPTPALELPSSPYIKKNITPKIVWNAQGSESGGLVYFAVQITWIGNGLIVPIIEVQSDGILDQSFTVPFYQRLKHTLAQDAGGEYEVLITASQDSSTAQIGGRFKVNFPPTQPLNLRIY